MPQTQTTTLKGTSVMPSLTVNDLAQSLRFFEGLGFEVEDRESADGKNWLVLAHHDTDVTPSVLEALRVRMTALAAPHGGDYDGWEAAVG